MKNEARNIELLGKYLFGDCSDRERKSVETWLKLSPNNQTIYDDYKKVWDFTGSEDSIIIVDVDKGWEELNSRIKDFEVLTAEVQVDEFVISKKILYRALRVAAVLIIAFGLFSLFNYVNNQESENLTFVTKEIAELPFVFEDGSKVSLNKNAKIDYPKFFSKEKREITFQGEAFFNIAHNPDKPFIINSGELQVEVLGTSFNLCTCPDGDEMILYLESGKVRFSSINLEDGSIREQLILTSGQKGIFSKVTGLLTRSEFEGQNYLAWKTGILEFKSMPLDEVFKIIEETYNLKITSEKKYNDLFLTARFDNESPKSIFESLNTIFGIEFELKDNTAFLN